MEVEQNLQELFNWVDSHAITRQKKNLNRDFSDAVPLAEILKQHFPRWVDLHNYAPKNSVAKKIDNWFTMNRKVLSKLEIQLTQGEMIKLAKSTPGAIEDLLFKIKMKIDEFEKEEAKHDTQDGSDNIADEKTTNDAMVPIELLERQALELDIKNEAIQILNQKVTHLQEVIDLKDKIILELKEKVENYNIVQELVPADYLEKQAFEIDLKNETINILNQKVIEYKYRFFEVNHLQSLIEMKNEHINELQNKLDDYISKENSCFVNKYLK